MKKLLLLNILLFVSVAFISCGNNDDTTDEQENILLHNGNKYSLAHGYIDYHGEWEDAYQYTIVLYTSEMHDTEDENNLSLIMISLATDNPETLETGTYLFSEIGEAGTFSFAETIYNLDNEEASYGDLGPLANGSIEVNKIGSTFEIIFEIVTTSNKTVTGYYKGALILGSF